jgi:hypothetical protein
VVLPLTTVYAKPRSTLDLDLSSRINLAEFQEKLVRALATDLGDYFEISLSGELLARDGEHHGRAVPPCALEACPEPTATVKVTV